MNHIGGFGFNPKTFERAAECAQHGTYTERGGSLTGDESRVKWFGCQECMKIEREQEAQAAALKAEAERQARIEARMRASGVPQAFRDRTFDSFIVETPEMQFALDVAREFADNFWSRHIKEGGFLVFGGSAGTGKSHLALSIAQSVLTRGTAMYMNAVDLVRRVRSTWHRDSEMTETAMMDMLGSQLDLLVIDEVGLQRGSDDEHLILFEIINRRYQDLRPTILLTNVTGAAFVDFMGPRLISRLHERAQFVAFKWPDHRSKVRK